MAVNIRKRSLADGSVVLYLDMYFDGKRHYENLHIRMPKEKRLHKEYIRMAEEIRAKRELEIQAAPHGYIPTFKKDASFIDFFEDLSNTRHKTWGTVLLHLKAFAGPDLSFKQLTKDWLNGFQGYLTVRVSQNSVNVYMHKIKAALNIAVMEGLITANPCNTINIVKTMPTERTYLTFDELQHLARTPSRDNEVKKAFLFACYTGLRLSDVRALTRGKIVNNKIQFRQKKTGGFEYQPLSPTAIQLIEPLGDSPDELLFKMPKSEGCIWENLQWWVARAGLDKYVSFHVSRHTFATLSLNATKDLYLVSKLLGHKDIKHTQIYVKIMDDRKDEAVAMLPQISL
jgi:integrase